MITQVEQRKAAKKFAEIWEGVGYEKGDSARFWISLLQDVYGVEKPTDFIRFEDRVMLDHTSFIDGYIPSTHVLIEQKSIDKDLGKAIRQSDGTLLTPFQQAKRYSSELPYSERPRWVVISNFKKFRIYDMEKPTGEPEILYLKNLEDEYYRLSFLVDKDDKHIQKAKEVSIKAGELVGILYNALLEEYNNPEDEKTLEDLNALSVRLVFCFYAEDSGLFGRRGMFHDYLANNKGVHFRGALINLFKVLNQKPEERDPYLIDDLAEFPYVNGGLFEDENITIPRINEKIIDIILNQASSNFDWSKISPTIFGSVFESTLNPETRRSGGMHYTSMENIHKVTDPLFMDELNEEFEKIKALKTIKIKENRLKEFQNKIASLNFLDPAAGSGNFLTETYISLRTLENKILKLLYGGQIVLGVDAVSPVKVSINQFYGIEVNDFAVTVAKTALWIAESQMLKETEDIIRTNINFLPIENDAKIVEGNALEINWMDVVQPRDLDFIIGNPPFIGASNMSKVQKTETQSVFKNAKKWGNLDYVASWYEIASNYMKDTSIECAFVSTNSIAQGEQPGILWKGLFDKGVIINFAHKTFIWNSEAVSQASVHCVIIGFSFIKRNKKFLYENGMGKQVSHINGYLLEASNTFIKRLRKPLSNVTKMIRGSSPVDNGNYIFSQVEMEEFVSRNKDLKKFIKKYIGAREFINNIPRYCIWLYEADPSEFRFSKDLMTRVENVVDYRLKSRKKQTRELAETPLKWEANRYNGNDYILIPRVSSERRKYIPIGFMDGNTIASDAVQLIPNAQIYDFGILTSNVHNGWMRAVAGRLKSDYRYSNLVYNSFVWPKPDIKQKNKIEKTGQAIINARNLYPNSSLADLYDDLTMPPELRRAHQENDKAVMEAYGFDWRTMTESECVAELMKMYEKLTASK